MTDDIITKIYIYKFKNQSYTKKDIVFEEVEVKETPKQFRCLNGTPFSYSRVLDKNKLDRVIDSFNNYIIYSLTKLDMETFKQMIVDYLESKRDQYRKKIIELDNCQEVLESLLKEKNEL